MAASGRKLKPSVMKDGILYVDKDDIKSIIITLAPLTIENFIYGERVVVVQNGEPDFSEVITSANSDKYQLEGRKLYDPEDDTDLFDMYGVVSIEYDMLYSQSLLNACNLVHIIPSQREIKESIVISWVPAIECTVDDIIMEGESWVRISNMTKGKYCMLIEFDEIEVGISPLFGENMISISLRRGG